jgi:hypothetical protein
LVNYAPLQPASVGEYPVSTSSTSALGKKEGLREKLEVRPAQISVMCQLGLGSCLLLLPLRSSHIRAENLSLYTANTHLRHVILACHPADLPASLLSTLPLEKVTLVESLPLPSSFAALPLKFARFPTLFTPPPEPKLPRQGPRGRNGPQLQLMQQEDGEGGSTWVVYQPERQRSQAPQLRRRGESEDGDNLSISIGPDNTVSVDSGRRRRLMG